MPNKNQHIYIAPRFDKSIPVVDRATKRKEIEDQTQAFLKKGGNVVSIEPGKSGYEFATLKEKSKKGKKKKPTKVKPEKIV